MKTDVIDFMQWMGIVELAARTQQEYIRYYNRLEKYTELNQETIQKFLDENNNMVARAFLKSLLQWLRSRPDKIIQLGLSPTIINNLSVPIPQGRAKKKKIINVVTQEEFNRLLQACSIQKYRAMLSVSFYGGVRIDELMQMTPYDFRLDKWIKDLNVNKIGEVIVHGKGNIDRNVNLPYDAMKEVYQYVSEGLKLNEPMWNIHRTTWRDYLRKLSLQVLGRPVHPHLLRHSAGTSLYENNIDLISIAEHLGHKSIATTQIYAHLSKEKLKEKLTDIWRKN